MPPTAIPTTSTHAPRRTSLTELAAALQFTTQAAVQRYLGDLIDLQQLDVTAQDATLSVTVKYIIRATQQQQTNTFVRSAP